MLEEERNNLITQHLPFVTHLANQYKHKADIEDLIQEGVLGLIRATNSFEKERDIKFITYASYWIKHYMLKYIEKESKYVQTNSMNELSYETAPELQILKQNIKSHLSQLNISERDLNIMIDRYLSEKLNSLQELGDKYKLSKQRIQQIEKTILKKVRKRLASV